LKLVAEAPEAPGAGGDTSGVVPPSVAPSGVDLMDPSVDPSPGVHNDDVDCGRSVVERLGEPTQKGGTGRQIWMTYAHLGMKIDLAAVDWDDGNAMVRGVALWSV